MRVTLVPFVVAVGLALPAGAASTDLLGVYQRALERDQQFNAARFAHQAALQDTPLARSALLPQISASFALGCQRQDQTTRTDNGVPTERPAECAELFGADTSRTDNFNASLNQALFSREAFLNLRRAKRSQLRAELALADAEQELLLRVSGAYFDVLAAWDSLRFSIAERNAVAEQRELAEQRFEVGLTAITDVQEAQARFDLTVAQVLEAGQALFSARDALAEIIDERPEHLMRPAEDFETTSPEPAQLDPWLDRALDTNLALRIATFDTELAERDIDIARAQRWPTLGLNGRYSRSEQSGFVTRTDAREVVLIAEMPLFTGGRISAEVDRNAALAAQADAERSATLRSVVRQTRDGFQSVRTSRARVRALERAVVSNRTALEAAQVGVEVGTRTALDVLDAQQVLFGAQRDLSRARFDYLLAILELKRASGELGAADLVAINNMLVQPVALQQPYDETDALFVE